MKIKKILSAALAGIMLVSAMALPISAGTITLSPVSTAAKYALKVKASVNIIKQTYKSDSRIVLSNNALANTVMDVTSNGKTLGFTVSGESGKAPKFNGQEITQTTIGFGLMSTKNQLRIGDWEDFYWEGYLMYSDLTKHPVNDLGLNLSSISLPLTIAIPYDGGSETVTLQNVTATVEPITETKTFKPGETITIKSYINSGNGFKVTEKTAFRTASNFKATIKLDKAITGEAEIFALSTNNVTTNATAIGYKGATSIEFPSIPTAYFYDAVMYKDYGVDTLFETLKISGPSGYEYTGITIDYTDGKTDSSTTVTPGTNTDTSTDDVAEEEFTINYSAVTLNVGKSLQLDTNFDDVTWKTSNKAKVRAFTNGKITAVATGTATITGTNSNKDKVVCKVTVVNSATPVTSLKFSGTSKTGYTKCSYSLGTLLTVNPTKTTDKITWTSSDENIATVSSAGKVSVIGTGTITITATASSGKSASLKLKCKASTLSLAKSSATISVGDTVKISATANPSSSKITYESANEGVATVNSSGTVTGINAGTAKIIVSSNKGPQKTFTVTVK